MLYISLSDMLEVVTFTVKINHVISLSEMLEVVTTTTSIDLEEVENETSFDDETKKQ
jgi:hypothetical protein